MKKKKSMLPGMMVMMGIGFGAYMWYKMNPKMMCDMKESIKNAAYRLADSLEDFDEM